MCLSALRTALAPQGMFVASAVYFMVGEFLFLLPPVPGPAVYVAGSMILPPIVSEEFGGGEGFGGFADEGGFGDGGDDDEFGGFG